MSRPKKPGPKVVGIEESSPGDVPPVATPDPPPSFPREKKSIPSFFAKVKAIPAADWGKRAYIYGYLLEPLCNLKTAGESKYLFKSSEPIFDEDSLMKDFGSGKYRLNLVYRKPAADKGDELDNVEIEIFNPKYPPKIPVKSWMNDPRNERWLALLPKEEPVQQPTGIGQLTDALKTFSEIRKDLKEEMAPAVQPVPQQDDMQKFTGMVTAIKTLFPEKPATDNTLLQTIVTLMNAQVQASQAEAKELRAQVLTMMQQQNKGAGDTIETLINKADTLLPKLRDLLGLGGEKLTDVVRGRKREWWEEVAIQAIPALAPGANAIMGALAQRFVVPGAMGGPANGQQALPAGQQQQQAAPGSIQVLQAQVGQYLTVNIKPVQNAFEHFLKHTPRDPDDPEQGTMDGTDLAEWIIDNHGEEPLKMARQLGSAQIVQMFKGSQYWPALAQHEAKLGEFLDDLLGYKPEPAEEDENTVAVAEED
jgi:ElaB/YqjD/DUF883 family membrane-anchored ribosome-binding protein